MNEVGVPVETLRAELKRWECENIELRLFDGGPYPPFMEAVDTYLPGQGFFPGGDGLWRELGDIAKTSGTSIAQRGIMILGNDFGNAVTFRRKKLPKGYEQDWTWDNLRPRIELSKLPLKRLFFTNSVMGLRKELGSKDKIDWVATNQTFANRCSSFLEAQIKLLQPKAIIVIGGNQLCVTDALFRVTKTPKCVAVTKTGFRATVVQRDHPSSDQYKPRPLNDHWKTEAEELDKAWNFACVQP